MWVRSNTCERQTANAQSDGQTHTPRVVRFVARSFAPQARLTSDVELDVLGLSLDALCFWEQADEHKVVEWLQTVFIDMVPLPEIYITCALTERNLAVNASSDLRCLWMVHTSRIQQYLTCKEMVFSPSEIFF